MSKKLTAVVFLILTLVLVSWLTGAAVETDEKAAKKVEVKKKLEEREAQIGELKEQIQEIRNALERDQSAEKVKELQDSLTEYSKQLDRLMAGSKKSPNPKGEFPDLERAIKQNREQLAKMKHALKEEGAAPDKLEGMQEKIKHKERELTELITHLEKRGADVKRQKTRQRSKLVIISLKHANAVNLSKVIAKFLTPSGAIAAYPDTNALVIRDSPAGLETAHLIIRELDVMRERGERRRRGDERRGRGEGDRPRREGGIAGKVIETGEKALTIETGEGKVTFYVPLRKREDGTSIPFEELSHHVASLKVGSQIKVQWMRREDSERLWIRRVDTGEPRFITGKVIEAGDKALTIETGEGKVTFYVPLRKREDGTRVPVKELSHHVASFEVGSTVKVQWIRGDDSEKLWIRRVEKVEQ